ncbi:30S ribosomal protein S19e [Candidatus Woesearchaeota archaeon]|nr:30S ribosomal protein S19e [Candidatus Woesearchaeota archaeon]
MSKIFDAQTKELLDLVSAELKKKREFSPPAWATYVKTGVNKERPPVSRDWWYVRTASVLRKVAILGPIGVNKLRVKYGGKKRRGHQPSEFRLASGNILRKILQQLEKAGYIKQVQIGVHKGRKLTPQGESFLDKLASTISKNTKKPVKESSDAIVQEETAGDDAKKQKKPRKKKVEQKAEEKTEEVKTN